MQSSIPEKINRTTTTYTLWRVITCCALHRNLHTKLRHPHLVRTFSYPPSVRYSEKGFLEGRGGLSPPEPLYRLPQDRSSAAKAPKAAPTQHYPTLPNTTPAVQHYPTLPNTTQRTPYPTQPYPTQPVPNATPTHPSPTYPYINHQLTHQPTHPSTHPTALSEYCCAKFTKRSLTLTP